TSLEQVLQSAADITERIDVRAWAELKRNRTDVLKVYPESLNNKLDGGAAGGDHIVVFARPEAGKSAWVINAMGGFARQGAPGLYIGNEDRKDRIEGRIISNLSGMTKH